MTKEELVKRLLQDQKQRKYDKERVLNSYECDAIAYSRKKKRR